MFKLFNYCNCYYTNNLLLLRTYLEIIYYYCRTKAIFLIVELEIRFIHCNYHQEPAISFVKAQPLQRNIVRHETSKARPSAKESQSFLPF